jgi:hypothetical protein
MNAQPRLSQLPIWERHESRVLAVLREALLIPARDAVTGTEPELNRRLYLALLEANRVVREAGGDCFDYPPAFEARNPPHPATGGATSERKIPDLSWSYLDHEQRDPEASGRHFVVECKRLGHASPAGWVFNERYVTDGINRFVDVEWRYGSGVSSGAMVGYVQSSTNAAILMEVNAATTAAGVAQLTAVAMGPGPLHELIQTLDRGFPLSPFRLQHVWVNLPDP